MRATNWLIVCVILFVSGCAAYPMHQDGMSMVQEGKVEEGLAKLAKAAEENPGNAEYRKNLYLAKMSVISQWLATAQNRIMLGDVASAESYFNKVLSIEPGNAQAIEGLLKLRRNKEYDDIIISAKEAMIAGDRDRALMLLRPILAEDSSYPAAQALKREIEEPLLTTHFQDLSLRDATAKPFNLEFRDANVRMVLEILSRDSGINFILDKDIPADLKTTVFLRNAYIDEVLDLILRTSQLRSKALNEKTVQIYPDTPEKRKEYQELVVRAFYLQDATAEQMQSTFKALLRMKDMVIDERLNLITVRDTPETVRLAEKLVALHDLSEPEVMLEVEVLEIQHDDLLKLGIQWPNQVTLTPLSTGNGTLTLADLKRLNSSRLGVSFSSPSINLREDHGASNLLANPRIRVHNREKAQIMIGDKVPVITTTSTSTGFVAENVQYLDVGLKLNVEPTIHPSNDVSLRLTMEVSSIANQVSTANGTLAYQIGTRNASTFLRLEDGETQILGGLISDQDRKSSSGIPGLSRLPILGRLFSAPSDSHSKTEIVLSITPRVVRNVARPVSQALEFWSGTENLLATKSMRLSTEAMGQNKKAEIVLNSAAPIANSNPNQIPQFIWSGPNQVIVGEQFTMSLRMKSSDSIRIPPIQVNFDSSVLEVTEIISGELINDEGDGGKPIIELDSQNGKLNVDMSSTKAWANMDGALITLKLRALATKTPTQLKVYKAQLDTPGNDLIAAPYSLSILP